MKAKKGKKQDTIESDLAHILGYTGTDMDPVGPPSPVGSEKDTAAAGDFAFMMLNFLFGLQIVCNCALLSICQWSREGFTFVTSAADCSVSLSVCPQCLACNLLILPCTTNSILCIKMLN